MPDLLESALAAIPEDFFHHLEERMQTCTLVAHEQAARTPPAVPAHRIRLGTTRYYERGEAFRMSVEDVGMRFRYEQANTHRFMLALCGRFLITHAKIDRWGDPLEQKDYKQALARNNPGDGEQLALWDNRDLDSGILAIVLVLYARSGSGQDETLPMRLGFGIPTRDLRGWHLLKTFDQLYAAYTECAGQPVDRARPRLKQEAKPLRHTDKASQ